MSRLVDDVTFKTNEFLQPNPISRQKLWTVNNLSKMRGQVKNTPYPQPEGVLGDAMCKYGKELSIGPGGSAEENSGGNVEDSSHFGSALNVVGESLRQMAGIKYALEDNIKQNFLDPLTQLKDTEIKEVLALRKKTENRRLDFDCKKRKRSSGNAAVTDEEVRMAEEKFEETKALTQQAMSRVLTNELEHITHLIGFAEGFLEYHNQCYEILKVYTTHLNINQNQSN
jgi:endophilin-A